MNYKLGFIGAGNMGGALLHAAAQTVSGGEIAVFDKNEQLLEKKAAEYGCKAETAETIANGCEYIFLGVKPQIAPAVCGEIGGILKARASKYTLVSMAAGLSIEKLRGYLGFDAPIIRIMPNTPVSVGEGMILYAAAENVPSEAVTEFLSIMEKAGSFDPIDEKLIDAASAVSGCGPAFVYMFIEALADGGVACGLPRAKAMTYAAQTLIGAAKMVQQSGAHPGQLKDNVCSPGGTTIAGVRALEEHSFRAAAMDAVIKAYEKTLELGK